MKYLYGAAVQGIQPFIFQTNRLRDIVGASELVSEICTTLFEQVLGKSLDNNAIINAAGNIKYEFDNKEECKSVVLRFPKKVQEFAPGITVSQAVVTYGPDTEGTAADCKDFSDAVNELERRLRIQRNRPMRSSTLGLMGMERSRQTGLPAIDVIYDEGVDKHDEYEDAGTIAKLYEIIKNENGELLRRKRTTFTLCEKSFGHKVKASQIAFNTEEMTSDNSWIAIIHIDGNSLGQVVRKIGKNRAMYQNFATCTVEKHLFKHTI